MEISVVTAEFVQRARLANACKLPEVGSPVSSLTQSQLIWFSDNGLLLPDELPDVPVWTFSGSGSGSGYGDGDGSGSGYGDGDGDGDGYGRE